MPLSENIIVPSHDHRHMSHIREGKISAEVWSKENLAKIELDYDIERPKEVGVSKLAGGGRERTDNAGSFAQTTKVGVRGKGSRVGSKASHEQNKTTSKAKARKKKVVRD